MTKKLIVKYSMVCLLSSLLAGCFHSPAKTLPEDLSTLTADPKALSKLTEEQSQHLEKYLYRHSAMKSVDDYFFHDANYPLATSIEDAIDIQKKFIDKSEKLKQENINISKKIKNNFYLDVEKIKQAVKVSFIDRKFTSDGNGDEKITLTLWMKNDSGKDIAKIKGRLIFLTDGGDVISKFNIVNHEFIKRGDSTVWKGSASLIMDIDGIKNSRFRKIPNTDFKNIWVTESIIFSDKSHLSIPD